MCKNFTTFLAPTPREGQGKGRALTRGTAAAAAAAVVMAAGADCMRNCPTLAVGGTRKVSVKES